MGRSTNGKPITPYAGSWAATLSGMPTDAELLALLRFRRAAGKTWKALLLQCWQRADYPAYLVSGDDAAHLQSIRNAHGPSWLMSRRCNPNDWSL